MKTILALLCILLLEVAPCRTQVVCPAGSTYVLEVFKYTWNNQCCDVEVEACIKSQPNATIEIKSIRIVGDCWGTINPATFPYNLIAQLGYEKILLRRSAAMGLGTIPQCPTVLYYTIKTQIGSCGIYLEYREPRGNPDGSQSWVTVRSYQPCGEVLCSQQCTVCIMTSVDPCTPSENRIYWSCEEQPSPPQCPLTGCVYPMCSGLP